LKAIARAGVGVDNIDLGCGDGQGDPGAQYGRGLYAIDQPSMRWR